MIKKLITILALTTSAAYATPLTAQAWIVADSNGRIF